MSLVAYGSSDESENESDSEKITTIDEKFSSAVNKPTNKPKQPVKISIPSLKEFEEEEDDSIKKPKPKGMIGSGLFSILPPPKNAIVSSSFTPYVLTKKKQPTSNVPKKEPKVFNQNIAKFFKTDTSTINKETSTTLNETVGPSYENDSSVSGDFFALENVPSENVAASQSNSEENFTPPQKLSASNISHSSSIEQSQEPSMDINKETYQSGTCENYAVTSNYVTNDSSFKKPLLSTDEQPHNLNLNMYQETYQQTPIENYVMPDNYNASESSFTNPSLEQPKDPNLNMHQETYQPTTVENYVVPNNYPAGDSSPFTNPSTSSEKTYDPKVGMHREPYQSQVPEKYLRPSDYLTGEHLAQAEKDIFHDKEFLKIHGKRQRLDTINFIDVRADDQLPDKRERLIKALTEETAHQPVKHKGNVPNAQQKRKHQITYLAFQAKQREQDLKNQWAMNARTRRETQAKYGF